LLKTKEIGMIQFSQIEPLYYLLPLLGLIIGLFGTVLGGGGGFFFLPILTLIFKVPTQTAVITSLVATVPICVFGSIGHYKKKNIDYSITEIFAIAGIIGTFAGAYLANLISSETLKISFGIYSIILAFNMAVSTHKKLKEERQGETKKLSQCTQITKGSFFGLFAGMITGAFGTSGTAPILSGLFSMRITIKKIIGTSLLIVLVNTIFAIGAHFIMGKIDLTLVMFLTIGSALGSIAGPKILATIKTDHSENKIRYIYATVMAALGVVMIIAK